MQPIKKNDFNIVKSLSKCKLLEKLTSNNLIRFYYILSEILSYILSEI